MSRPNILLFISDDHGWDDLSCHGSSNVATPHMDRLASGGMRLSRHYSTAPICGPARTSIYTGLYPVRAGAWSNHSFAYDTVRSLPHHLRELGYRVGLHQKVHVGPPEVFPFDTVEEPSEYLALDGPCCLVIASHKPHAPWGACPEDSLSPESLSLPPTWVDTPGTRDAYARYLGEVQRLDQQLGDVLEDVERLGQVNSTLVIYTSDHGAQFPGGKWTCYEAGLHVPMILRWPQRIRSGSISNALTQHVDLLPTILEVVGGKPSDANCGVGGSPQDGDGFDGMSILPLLMGKNHRHRDAVFGISTQEGTVLGVPYGVRSVFDGTHKYIRNLNHETTYQNVMLGPTNPQHENLYWPEWTDAALSDSHANQLVQRHLKRPAEEFYDLASDPYELYNCFGRNATNRYVNRLCGLLHSWMNQQGDKGIDTEMAAILRQTWRDPKDTGPLV